MKFERKDDVAVLHFDDGKANAVGHTLLDSLHEGLDQAAAEAKAVVVTGRDGVFSAGFDLKEIQKGPEAAAALVGKGAKTFLRLFSHSQPVVMACTGHAIAAGAFLLLTGDNRIGAAGEFKLGLNETAIGMSFPVFGIQLATARLDPRHLTRAVVQSELYDPDGAVAAGYLDRVLPPEQVLDAAIAQAAALAELPGAAYAKNKLDVRAPYLAAIEASLD
ncbi:MAG: crotonase/enoyl-CoA hydratase family protein [Pseudomonadota bacterium]